MENNKRRKIIFILLVIAVVIIVLLLRFCDKREFVTELKDGLRFGRYKNEEIILSESNREQSYYFELSSPESILYDLFIYGNGDNDILNKEISISLKRNDKYIIGSLCDLTSGSGDKGTPVVYIQGYFDSYSD